MLTVRYIVLEEIRFFGSYERLNQRFDYYLDSANVTALFDKVFQRMEEDLDPEAPQLVRTIVRQC